MRSRYWALIPMLLLLLSFAACSGNKAEATPTRPVRTPRPTFTPTALRKGVQLVATSTRRPTITPTAGPKESPTPEAPQAGAPVTPTVASQVAMLTVSNATLNVRGGPGTNYPVIGQVKQDQQFEITGKNEEGDWWEFSYEGKPGWVIGSMVTVDDAAASVAVAADIPEAPPTPRPRPTSPPGAPAPTAKPAAPAAPATKFAVAAAERRLNLNTIITIRCKVGPNNATPLAGTLRVTRGGATLADKAFNAIFARVTGMGPENEYIYNDGCKVELPLQEGGYQAYLIEGGNRVSDVAEFEVSGEFREIILWWKPR